MYLLIFWPIALWLLFSRKKLKYIWKLKIIIFIHIIYLVGKKQKVLSIETWKEWYLCWKVNYLLKKWKFLMLMESLPIKDQCNNPTFSPTWESNKFILQNKKNVHSNKNKSCHDFIVPFSNSFVHLQPIH